MGVFHHKLFHYAPRTVLDFRFVGQADCLNQVEMNLQLVQDLAACCVVLVNHAVHEVYWNLERKLVFRTAFRNDPIFECLKNLRTNFSIVHILLTGFVNESTSEVALPNYEFAYILP